MLQKITNVLAIIFGILMIVFGANKFLPFMPMPEMSAEMQQVFEAFGKIKWIMPLVGVVEVGAGLLMIFKKTRALAAIMFLPITIGILIQNFTHDKTGLPISLLFLAINILVIMQHSKQYEPMIQN